MRPMQPAGRRGRLALTRVVGEKLRLRARGHCVELELVAVEDGEARLKLVSPGFLPFAFRLPRAEEAACLLPIQGHLVRFYLSRNQPRGVGRARLVFEAPESVRVERSELPMTANDRPKSRPAGRAGAVAPPMSRTA